MSFSVVLDEDSDRSNIELLKEKSAEITEVQITIGMKNQHYKLSSRVFGPSVIEFLDECMKLPNLKKLKIIECDIQPLTGRIEEKFYNLVSLPSITDLEYHGDKNIVSDAKNIIISFKNPKTVNLSDFPNVEDLSASNCSLEIDSNHPNIKFLNVDGINTKPNVKLPNLEKVYANKINFLPIMKSLKVFAILQKALPEFYTKLEGLKIYSSQIPMITELGDLKFLTIELNGDVEYNPILDNLEYISITGKRVSEQDCKNINMYKCHKRIEINSEFVLDSNSNNIHLHNTTCVGGIEKSKNIVLTLDKESYIWMTKSVYENSQLDFEHMIVHYEGSYIPVLTHNARNFYVDGVNFSDNFPRDMTFGESMIECIDIGEFRNISLYDDCNLRKIQMESHSILQNVDIEGYFLENSSIEINELPSNIKKFHIQVKSKEKISGSIKISKLPETLKTLYIDCFSVDLLIDIDEIPEGVIYCTFYGAKGSLKLEKLPVYFKSLIIYNSPELECSLPDDKRIKILEVPREYTTREKELEYHKWMSSGSFDDW